MKRKGFSNIILVLLIVILLGVIGYLLFVEKQKSVVQQSTSDSNQVPTSTEIPIQTSTQTSISTTLVSLSITADLIKKVITNLNLPAGFDKTSLDVRLNDLDRDSVPEIIIYSPKQYEYGVGTEFYVAILKIKNDFGDFEVLADGILKTREEVKVGSSANIIENLINYLKSPYYKDYPDISGDGFGEIFITVTGGASGGGELIGIADLKTKRISLIKDKDGNDFVIYYYTTASTFSGVKYKDINNNGADDVIVYSAKINPQTQKIEVNSISFSVFTFQGGKLIENPHLKTEEVYNELKRDLIAR